MQIFAFDQKNSTGDFIPCENIDITIVNFKSASEDFRYRNLRFNLPLKFIHPRRHVLSEFLSPSIRGFPGPRPHRPGLNLRKREAALIVTSDRKAYAISKKSGCNDEFWIFRLINLNDRS